MLARQLLIFCTVLFVAGCARYTTGATENLMPGETFPSYRYVHVLPPEKLSSESAEEAGVRPHVEKGLARIGFEVLGKSAFARLADDERPLALTCKVEPVWRALGATRVTLELLDWRSELVFSVTGEANGTGITTTIEGELSRAADAALTILERRHRGLGANPGEEPETAAPPEIRD